MRRASVRIVGLWIALALLIAILRPVGSWLAPAAFTARDFETQGRDPVRFAVPLGDVIAVLGPPETLSATITSREVFLELNFATLHLMLFVKLVRDSGGCVRVHPRDRVQILAVWRADQPPSGKVYYPQVQPWAGFTRYCFQ